MKNMISKNIKYLRDKNELTQEQFAEKVGVSRQTVAKWENGESMPDIDKCAEISMMYRISIDALVTCLLDETMEPDGSEAGDKYVFGIVKVGERGQVVVPKHARKVYDIKPGDKILVLGDEKGMAFAKINGLSMFHFGG